jgi:hypothetical protein
MTPDEPILILYPQTPPDVDKVLAEALRNNGMTVNELVIGQTYEAVLDALETGAIPVVVK